MEYKDKIIGSAFIHTIDFIEKETNKIESILRINYGYNEKSEDISYSFDEFIKLLNYISASKINLEDVGAYFFENHYECETKYMDEAMIEFIKKSNEVYPDTKLKIIFRDETIGEGDFNKEYRINLNLILDDLKHDGNVSKFTKGGFKHYFGVVSNSEPIVREEREINKDNEYIFYVDNIVVSELNGALKDVKPGREYSIDYLYGKLIVTEEIERRKKRKKITTNSRPQQ